MHVPADLKYTKSHEWVRLEGDMATVGITDFAQQQLGDLTYIELPEPGAPVDAEDEIAVVESVKAASDIYAPLSGTIAEVNRTLEDSPEAVNSDPFGDGWLFKLKVEDKSELHELLEPEQYEDTLPEED
jgi:glycine cleavage system H protein